MESELMALVDTCQSVVWVRKLLRFLEESFRPATKVYEDNVAAQLNSEAERTWRSARHISTRVAKLREWIKENAVEIERVASRNNPADFFTKALGLELFLRFRDCLMI
jgi:hypothetical protein